MDLVTLTAARRELGSVQTKTGKHVLEQTIGVLQKRKPLALLLNAMHLLMVTGADGQNGEHAVSPVTREHIPEPEHVMIHNQNMEVHNARVMQLTSNPVP